MHNRRFSPGLDSAAWCDGNGVNAGADPNVIVGHLMARDRLVQQRHRSQTNYIVVDGVNSASGTLRMKFSLATRATLASQGFTAQRAHKLRVATHVGANFAIQFSTDLKSWTTLTTTTNLPGSLFDYTDPGAANAPSRFYRALMLP